MADVGNELLSGMIRLTPDLMDEVRKRASVLERIAALQPVGRRALSQRLRIPEREIRGLTDRLRDAGFLKVDASGMMLSDKGMDILSEARALTHALSGLGSLEGTLSRALGAGRVCVVRGDGDGDPEALREAGRVTVRHLVGMLSDGMTLTVSGGQCVAAAAEAALREAPALDVSVLPGQGGTDADLNLQAGTLAARFAAALGGRHAQLHVPDRLTPEALRSLMELPDVSAAVNAMHRTDVLLYGIERADEAMKAQPLPESESGFNAVGEALGSYFDADGRLVYKASSIGLSGEELRRVPHVIAVATGASRAQAVMAVMRHHHHDLLVIDEGAARAIAAAL